MPAARSLVSQEANGIHDTTVQSFMQCDVVFLQLTGEKFQPGFIGKEANGVHDTNFQSIMKCDVVLLQLPRGVLRSVLS